MAATTAVRQAVWNGSLPLNIVLAENEARSNTRHEYLVTVNRISYLPLYLKQALNYFRPYLNNPRDADDMGWWFEFENVPIRWNWPIGLSFDLLTGLDPTRDNEMLPWTLTLKHKEYPKDYIMMLQEGALEDYWLNQSKESCCIRDGNPKALMTLSTTESTDLWKSIEKLEFASYWAIMDKVLPSANSYRHIPVKLYFPVSNTVKQTLVKPLLADRDSKQTVGTALNQHLPELFPSRRTCVLARPLMHGAVLPMEAPLTEILPQCMYLDGFLHISIVMMS